MDGNFRELFDVPEDVAYFNCAANSPQLRRSTAAMVEGVQRKGEPWKRKPENFFDLAEEVRTLAAQIFGGAADGYAVVPSVSYAISAAARIVESEVSPRHNIVVMQEEFPSNVLPWQRVCRESGAELISVPRAAHGDWTQGVLKAVSGDTKVVAVSPCHWTDGTLLDLHAIKARCLETGSLLVVDATQSLGAVPIDIEAIDPDFLAAAGYKWLLSPYGFSLFYVSPRHWGKRPLEESWLARVGASDFAGLVRYNQDYLPGARRFEVGEKNSPAILPGAIEALKQIGEWGVPKISRHLYGVNRLLIEGFRSLGFTVSQNTSPHMFGASPAPRLLSRVTLGEVVRRLSVGGVYISQRGSSLRISPHLHVTPRDIDSLLGAIAEI